MVPWVFRHCTCDLGPCFPVTPGSIFTMQITGLCFRWSGWVHHPGPFLFPSCCFDHVARQHTLHKLCRGLLQMQSLVTLCVMVSMLHFDILWNLILSDEALRPARPEQQAYPPAVLSQECLLDVVEERGVFAVLLLCLCNSLSLNCIQG